MHSNGGERREGNCVGGATRVMSPHHSDQMSQWSQVSRIALCMSKVKVSQSVTELVSDKVTY